MRFSLIVATYGRTDELNDLFDSLSKQIYKDFEVIVVDQNQGNEVELIVNIFKTSIDINYIKSIRKGLSLARNIGLKEAKGEIIAFPDDDCVYKFDTLENVNIILSNVNINFCSGLPINIIDEKPLALKTPLKETIINFGNVFSTIISFTLFVKKEYIVFFDEKFGVGAKYGSGEESDFSIQMLKNKALGFYCPDKIKIKHPDVVVRDYNENVKSKNRNYAIGLGALFRKHFYMVITLKLAKIFVLSMFVRPIAGIILGLIRWQRSEILRCKDNLIYRWNGFLNYN